MSAGVLELRMTKQQVLDRLREQRAIAEKQDASRMAAHRVKEKEALALFRQRVREAAKWDYAKVKENRMAGLRHSDIPDCPRLLVPRYDKMIRSVEGDTRTKYVLRPRQPLHSLLTEDWVVEKEACE